jgi:hypothetical protein
LVPSFYGGDDFVGVLGKGLWVCIGIVEEAVDGMFEFLEGAEYAALEALFGEFRKEANFLDEADPSANGPVKAASTTDIRRM